MSAPRIGRNDFCPCGSGKKFKHCCFREAFKGRVPQPRPVPGDGASVTVPWETPRSTPPRTSPTPAKAITRVAVDYVITDTSGKAEVTYYYPLRTRIIMADGNVLPVEYLKPGMRFRLEDGGVAMVTAVAEPKVYEPPSQQRDANGNALRRVIGTVKYTGYYPRLDLGIPGDVLKTTPGHLFYSLDRREWVPAETFQPGEMLRNPQGVPVPVESASAIFFEHGSLYNVEVEDFHTYYVGNGPHGGVLTHNGMGMGCRVPRAEAEQGPSGELSTLKYLKNNWDKATFGNVMKSVLYHVTKHGKGLWAIQYTQAALRAFKNPNAVKTAAVDLLGRPAVKVAAREGSGLFTPHGRIVWFHPAG